MSSVGHVNLLHKRTARQFATLATQDVLAYTPMQVIKIALPSIGLDGFGLWALSSLHILYGEDEKIKQ